MYGESDLQKKTTVEETGGARLGLGFGEPGERGWAIHDPNR